MKDKGFTEEQMKPITKLWMRFLRNTKSNCSYFANRFSNYINMKVQNNKLFDDLIDKGFSVDLARQLSMQYTIGITEEGLLATFKVSDEMLTKWVLDENNKPVQVERYPKKLKGIDENTGLMIYEEPEEVVNEERVFKPAIYTNGDNFYCYPVGSNDKGKAGQIIKVGHVIELPSWAFVNCYDEQSCVKGLHKKDVA